MPPNFSLQKRMRRRALPGDYAGMLRLDCFAGVWLKTRDALPGPTPRCAGRRACGKAWASVSQPREMKSFTAT